MIENVTVCPNLMWSVVSFFNLKAKLLLIFKEKIQITVAIKKKTFVNYFLFGCRFNLIIVNNHADPDLI